MSHGAWGMSHGVGDGAVAHPPAASLPNLHGAGSRKRPPEIHEGAEQGAPSKPSSEFKPFAKKIAEKIESNFSVARRERRSAAGCVTESGTTLRGSLADFDQGSERSEPTANPKKTISFSAKIFGKGSILLCATITDFRNWKHVGSNVCREVAWASCPCLLADRTLNNKSRRDRGKTRQSGA